MTGKSEDQTDFLGAHADSMLRHAHWWLAAFVVFLAVATFFEPVTLGYAGYSLAFGFVWCALTLVTWRRRSGILSVVTPIVIFQAHYLASTLHPPHRPAITGILISGIVMFCILRLARSRVRRCHLRQ